MLELCLRYAHPDSVAPPEIPFRGILDPVARKLRLPFKTPDFIDRIIRGGVNQAGRRTLQMLLTTWDATGGGPFAASAIATAGLVGARLPRPGSHDLRRANSTTLVAQGVDVKTALTWSGRGDSNPRPQRPERCALTKLRYFPVAGDSS